MNLRCELKDVCRYARRQGVTCCRVCKRAWRCASKCVLRGGCGYIDILKKPLFSAEITDLDK